MLKRVYFQDLVLRVLQSRLQYGPLFVWEIAGIILGIIGLLKQEEQKHWAIIGIIVCIVRVIGALALSGNL